MKLMTTTNAWRAAIVASGVALLIGGPMHPESDAKDSMRDELATMTSHDHWVLSHAFIVLSSVLLATALWLAHRQRAWPASLQRVSKVGAVVVSCYVVETVFHLASKLDTDALRDGDAAPVAFTHLALALVLYPITGLTLAYLAARVLQVVSPARKLFAGLGIAAGIAHALSVPLTVIFPDTEFTPLFAGSAMFMAVWSIGTGVLGIAERRRPVAAAGAAAHTSVDTATKAPVAVG